MRKLTSVETRLLAIIASAPGGAVCPGSDALVLRPAMRALRRLVARGDLTNEETQDGPRFHITEQGRMEVRHG